MASTSPRKSIDSLASGVSTPALSNYSTPQLESPRVPPQRYPLRRGSTASSIVSIGGILDTSQPHGSIAESGQNGMLSMPLTYRILTGSPLRSHFDPPPSTDSSHRLDPSYCRFLNRIQAPVISRYSAGHTDKYRSCGLQSVPALLVASGILVRCLPTVERRLQR